MKFLAWSFAVILSIFLNSQQVKAQSDTSKTYYVDCVQGIDTNTGLSPSLAWKSMAKANTASLNPGDSLLFKRSCTWTNTATGNFLNARWNGTADNPITIGAYGGGVKPIIQSDANGSRTNQVSINVSGSFQILQNLSVKLINPRRELSCMQADGLGVPLGWYVGFTVSGSNNTINDVEAQNLSIAVNLTDNSRNNKVANLYAHHLDAFWRIDPVLNALGGLGVNLHGHDNEISDSLFEDNGAICNYVDSSGVPTSAREQNYSAPFELYNANGSFVHHNKAYGHRKHFEMGKDANHTANDNVIAYNLFVSDLPEARGPNIHGNDQFGPVNNTTIVNNTIVLTGSGSQALICDCTGGATIQNNILAAELKSAFYSAGSNESYNIYWDYGRTTDPNPDPFVQFIGGSLSSTSKKLDPKFANAQLVSGNYRLSSVSPAIDAASPGQALTTISTDLNGTTIPQPQGARLDIGAFEYVIASTPTQTPLVGDANNDGLVDNADFNIWKTNFGNSTSDGAASGDFNGDQKVNTLDLALWFLNYTG